MQIVLPFCETETVLTASLCRVRQSRILRAFKLKTLTWPDLPPAMTSSPRVNQLISIKLIRLIDHNLSLIYEGLM